MISRSGTLFQPRGLFLASGGVLRPQSGSVDMSSLHFGMPHMGFGERGNGKVNLDLAFRSTFIVDLALDQIQKFKIPATFKTLLLCKELYEVHGA